MVSVRFHTIEYGNLEHAEKNRVGPIFHAFHFILGHQRNGAAKTFKAVVKVVRRGDGYEIHKCEITDRKGEAKELKSNEIPEAVAAVKKYLANPRNNKKRFAGKKSIGEDFMPLLKILEAKHFTDSA